MKHGIDAFFRGSYLGFYSKYLQGIKKSGGDEVIALCPFHEDTKPSFNFNNKTSQFFCHGCGEKGDFFHFYGKINSLDTRRDFNKILKGIVNDFKIPWEDSKDPGRKATKKGSRGRLVKIYDYRDLNGELMHQTLRYENPKSFSQRRPNGRGGWILQDVFKGINPVLYNLKNVRKAKEIIITEGEKDSDRLNELGFISTTCAMGAGSWRDDYNQYLKGKHIVLVPDNDEGGREHMAQVAGYLNRAAKSLKWIELPGLPEKGDVSDWIDTFDPPEEAAEALAVMINRADLYLPPKEMTLEDVILSTRELVRMDIPKKQVLLHPWVNEEGIILGSGWRGIGKSWFGLGLTDAVSRGASFGPWECMKSVPCLFLDGEMPASDIVERVKALNLHSDRPNPLYIYSDALATNTFGLPRAHLGNESWRKEMKEILLSRKIKLWVIDNLASLTSGIDENVKKDWDPINQWLLDLRFSGITTVMLHHLNKLGGQRGTSAREDNLDVSLMLKAPHDHTPEDGARFIVHFTKARIATKDLQLIADVEFRLIQDELGRYLWTCGNIRRERKREILKMLGDGIDYNSIVDSLDVTKGYITKVKKQAIKNGHLTTKCKLTQTGFLLVSED